MAKASDLIGRSGAGGLGPPPKTLSSDFTTPPPDSGKKDKKSGQTARKETKPARSDAKAKGSGGSGATTSPSVRPKV